MFEDVTYWPWWRHQMEIFSALLTLCAGNSPVTGEFPAQRPVTRSFDVYFDLRLNNLLSKQPRRWWFETPSDPLWRHGNECQEQYHDSCSYPLLSRYYIVGCLEYYFTRILQNTGTVIIFDNTLYIQPAAHRWWQKLWMFMKVSILTYDITLPIYFKVCYNRSCRH